MAARVFHKGLACSGRKFLQRGRDVGTQRVSKRVSRHHFRRRNRHSRNAIPLRKGRLQQGKGSGMAPFWEQLPRELSWQKPLAGAAPDGTPAAVSVVFQEGNVSEDHVEPLGLAVGKGADEQRHPVLEAGGREGGDDGLAGDGFLDEVVLAAEVGVEEGEAADGFVVAGVEDACDGDEYENAYEGKGGGTTYVERERIHCRACSGCRI